MRRRAAAVPPGGELVVRVPCRLGRSALEQLVPPARWTRRELCSLLADAGLEPVQLRLVPDRDGEWIAPRLDGGTVDATVGRVTLHGLAADELEEFAAAEIEAAAVRRGEFEDAAECTVVVAGRGSRRRLSRCLAALEGDVVTVDRAGLTLAEAWNEGARRARGRFLAFVDGDTVAETGWVAALAEAYGREPQAGIVGSLLVTRSGAVDHAGVVFGPFGIPYHRRRGASPELAAVAAQCSVPALAGSGLYLPRRTFVRIGGFDERLPDAHAVVDLCLRLRARGFTPVYCPRSRLRRLADAVADRSEAACAGDRLLLAKWQSRLSVEEEPGSDPVAARPLRSAVRGACGLVWSAPLFARSGYAEEARTFLLALERAGYAPKADDLFGAGRGGGEADRRLRELASAPLPERFAHVVHNPGPGVGVYPQALRRVWRTMFESDGLPPGWAEYGNQMDEVWVPSAFNVDTFARAGVRPEKLRVLPGGLDFAPYNQKIEPLRLEGRRRFVFLCNFIAQRRKGWDVLLRAFYEEFDADEDVTLLLKLAPDPARAAEYTRLIDTFVRDELRRDPLIGSRLLITHFDLEPEVMPQLYRAADAYVLPSRGEGWSRTCMEAMAMGVPVIATRWGGHMEFMNDRNAFLLDYALAPVDELSVRELPLFAGQRWAEPSLPHLRALLRHVYTDRADADTRAAQGRRDVVAGFGLERTAAALLERIEGLGVKMRRAARVAAPIPPRPRAAAEPVPLVWSSPLFDRSGYANEARSFILALDRADIDVRVNPSFVTTTRGWTPPSAAQLRLRTLHAERPPDRFVHVVHAPSPNFELDAPAVRTVWRTMFETDGLPPSWVARCNEVDAVWVPSHFNVESFARAGVDPRKLRWVPEGLETELYDLTVPPLAISGTRGFVFLSVFGWGRRKGWDVLARAYLEEFAADEDVSLVLAVTPSFGLSIDDHRAELERTVQSAKDDGPPIVVFDPDLMPEEMPRLYRAADAFVLPSRGEGWGRTHMEAMAMGVPTIGSRCPGTVEFLRDNNGYLVDCAWQPVPEAAAREFPLYRGHRWCEPSVEQLRAHMRHVVEHRTEAARRAATARAEVLTRWDWRRLAGEVELALDDLGCAAARRRRRPTATPTDAQPVPALATTARNTERLADVMRGGWSLAATPDRPITRAEILQRVEAAGLEAASLRLVPDRVLHPLRGIPDGAPVRIDAGPLVCWRASADELEEASAKEIEVRTRPRSANPPLWTVVVAADGSLAATWNERAALATARFLAFTRDDDEPDPGWLDALLEAHGSLPEIGIVGSRLEWEGRVVHAGVALGAQGLPYLLYSGLRAGSPQTLRRRVMSAVTGTGILVERRTFVAAGGFDESLPAGYEAIDLSLRLRTRGLRSLYCPESRIERPPLQLDSDGDRALLERWPGRLAAEDEPICRQDGTDVRAVRPAPRRAQGTSGLLWTAHFHTRTGYAEEARALVLALDRAGIEVDIEPLDTGELVLRPSPNDHRLLQLARTVRAHDFVRVHHYPSTLFRATKPALRSVWRTMFETDSLPRDWVAQANEMDEVWVPTDFNLETFTNAGVQMEKLHVVPQAMLLDGYDPAVAPLPLPADVRGFVFLSIFGWEPRKGWDVLLRAYLEEFAPDEEVTLALKIFPHYQASFSELARTVAEFGIQATGRRSSQLPRVVLVDQRISPEEMPRLYRAADAYVLPSRGEGWGRTHMEAMAMGLPVIATRWSGNLEFMNDTNSYLVNCRLQPVTAAAGRATPHYRGHRWAEPSVTHLRSLLRHVYEAREEASARGTRARADVFAGFGIERAAAAVVERLEAMGTAPRRSPRGRLPRILWQGPQFTDEHCASFNRSITHALLDSGRANIMLSGTEQEPLAPATARDRWAREAGRPFEGDPDVVVTSAPAPAAQPSTAQRRVGVVTWPHGSLPKAWVEAAEHLDEVWAPSDYLHDCCIRSGIDPAKLARIRPVAEPGGTRRMLSLATRKRFRFLHLGDGGLEDGTDALLAAFADAFSAADDVCLVISPRGRSAALDRTVERFRSDPGAPELLVLDPSARTVLVALAGACDCIVHVRRSDTLWQELARAQACGLAAVVADHGTAPELCDRDATLLVPATEVQLPERSVAGHETIGFPWWCDVDPSTLARALRHAFELPAVATPGVRFSAHTAANAVLERIAAPAPRRVARPPGLSLCMMVQNEERYLAECLRSVEGLVSEIVVVDTGSTDRTVEIAESFGARVEHLPWSDDFAGPRNAAIDRATQPWILMIDGDHTLDPSSRDEVRRLTFTRGLVGYMLRGINYTDPSGSEVFEGYDPRLFPNHPAIRFSGTVHEQLTCSDAALAFHVVPCSIILHHHGTRADGYVRLPKLERDIPMLEAAVAAAPNDAFQLHNLGSTYLFLGRYADAEPVLRTAVELCRRNSTPTAYPQYMLTALLHLARALLGLGRLEEAAATCDQAIQAAPGLADAHAVAGIVLARLGRLDDAAACFTAALHCPEWPMYATTDPSWRSWRSLLALAEVQQAQGRLDEARATAKRAAALRQADTR